jgi:hypothetical protein
MLKDVFISCAPNDESVAREVAQFLEKEGITCGIFGCDPGSGAGQEASVDAALDESQVLILIFSESANGSALVQDEVERALRAEKILIPLRIENVAPTGRMEELLRHRFRHDAFVGPLERHLPELVRMLKPVLHRLVAKTHEATSISRTLPSRSSIVRGLNEPKAGSNAGPLEVALHFPHPVFAGHPTRLDVRVRGFSGSAGRARLTVEGLGLKQNMSVALPDISLPEQHVRLALEPRKSGKFPLHVILVVDGLETRLQLAGVTTVRVNPAHSTTELVRPDEVLVNQGKADLFLRAPSKAAEAGMLIDEILAIEIPQEFEVVELRQEFTVGRAALKALELTGPLKLPPAFTGTGQTGTRLRLESEKASADFPFQKIRLVARNQFAIGRSGEESDYLAWFWPRNEIHDTKTRRISKRHCTFVREGANIAVRTMASGSMTSFDGEDLSGSDTFNLDGVGTLNLSGIYELEFARFPSTLQAHSGSAPHEETPRGSVAFISRTPNVLPQSALWLFTDGSFGSSRANPLMLDVEGIAEIQGRFHYDQGFFWIESVIDNDAVQVDDLKLERGQIVPLRQGMRVRLGDQDYRVGIEA